MLQGYRCVVRLSVAIAASVCSWLALAAGAPAARLAPCAASQLSGTFRVIYGSAGAGSISYALRLTNRSRTTCFVSGLARLRLLGRAGRPLPTQVRPAFRRAPAARVVLRPGARAKATARFSPDVPGPGEPVARTCEPRADRVRVTPRAGGGTLVVPVAPPTPVCEHGRIFLSAFSRA